MCCEPSIEPRFGDVHLKDVNMSDGGLSAEEPHVALKKNPETEGAKMRVSIACCSSEYRAGLI